MDQIPLLLELKQTLGRLSVLDITIGRQAKCTPILIESLPQVSIIKKKLISTTFNKTLILDKTQHIESNREPIFINCLISNR